MFSKILLISLSLAVLQPKSIDKVNQLVDAWHLHASQANFNSYFDLMAENAVFIGTAPGERWTKKEFMEFCKPYFDRGKAWDFKSRKRNWTFSANGKTAWFDEVLDTWMLDCSGSGVVRKIKGQWKIVFYDLHVLVENEKMKEFLELRKSE